MNVIDTISNSLVGGIPVSMESLGGFSSIAGAASEVFASPFFDEVVGVLSDAWNSGVPKDEAANFIVAGIAATSRPIPMANALDRLLTGPAFDDVWPKALPALIARGKTQRYDAPLIAALCLEGATRIALLRSVSKIPLYSAFDSVLGDESEIFVSRVARLIGITHETWRVDDVLGVLERMLTCEGAQADVCFELGLANMTKALDESSREKVLSYLSKARTWFLRTEQAQELRTDAVAYGAVIEVVTVFAGGGKNDEVHPPLARLAEAIFVGDAWVVRRQGPDWLRPRRRAFVEWTNLVTGLNHLAEELDRDSWLRAVDVLERLLRTHAAARSISPAGFGIGELVRPRIEGAFVRRSGLRAHLEQWLSEVPKDSELYSEASALKGRVRLRQDEQEEIGGNEQVAGGSLVAFPVLQADLGRIVGRSSDGLRSVLADRAHILATTTTRFDSIVMDDLFDKIDEELSKNSDYAGVVRERFRQVLELTLRFLKDRSDGEKLTLGDRGKYLFEWPRNANPPLERELGQDYRDFLVGSPIGSAIQAEVHDVAGGRVDVLVNLARFKFVAELKRELSDAGRDSLRAYLGQAAAYSGTDVHLGFLLVLDLTKKPSGSSSIRENIWVEVVGNKNPRHIVVVRIPGNRKSPSALVTPPLAAVP